MKLKDELISSFANIKNELNTKKGKEKLAKKIVITFFGAVMIMLGVSLFVRSDIGCDSVNIFLDGLVKKTNLTMGFWTFISGCFFILTALILDKKNVGITTIMYVLICQPIIDGFDLLLPDCTSLFMSLVYVLLGVFVASLGAVLCICAGLGLSIYEAFCCSITNHFKLKYLYVRLSIDAFFVIAGYLLGGSVGLGTIIALFLFGPLIDTIRKLIEEKVINYINC